jgi:hypothetical protein
LGGGGPANVRYTVLGSDRGLHGSSSSPLKEGDAFRHGTRSWMGAWPEGDFPRTTVVPNIT